MPPHPSTPSPPPPHPHPSLKFPLFFSLAIPNSDVSLYWELFRFDCLCYKSHTELSVSPSLCSLISSLSTVTILLWLSICLCVSLFYFLPSLFLSIFSVLFYPPLSCHLFPSFFLWSPSSCLSVSLFSSLSILLPLFLCDSHSVSSGLCIFFSFTYLCCAAGVCILPRLCDGVPQGLRQQQQDGPSGLRKLQTCLSQMAFPHHQGSHSLQTHKSLVIKQTTSC